MKMFREYYIDKGGKTARGSTDINLCLHKAEEGMLNDHAKAIEQLQKENEELRERLDLLEKWQRHSPPIIIR